MPIYETIYDQRAEEEAALARRFVREPEPEETPLRTAVEIACEQDQDSERVRRRKVIHDKRSRAKMAEQERQEIVFKIDAVNERKEDIAAAHVVTCAPIQSKLKAKGDECVQLISARQPVPAELDAERRELIAKIEQLNRDLAAAIEAEDGALARLEQDRIVAAQQASEASLLSGELLKLGRPDLLIAFQVAEDALHWADTRCAAAQENWTRTGATSSRRVTGELAAAVRAAAGKAFAAARAARDEAYRDLLEE